MVSCSCLISAFCFIVSNALGIAVVVENVVYRDFDSVLWKALDSEYIRETWDFRRSIAPLQATSNIFNAAAWLAFSLPVLQLSWTLSRGGKRKVGVHTAIAVLCIAGSMGELVSRLFMFGAFGSASWISNSFNLDKWTNDQGSGSNDMIGWKCLEVSWMLIEGLLLWIDAFEWICLFGILVLLYFSVGTQLKEHRTLPLWWARTGLFIAFLAFVDFAADLLRLEEFRTFAEFAIVIAIVNTCVLLPLWLIVLSCHLHKTLPDFNEDIDNHWSAGEVTTSSSTPNNNQAVVSST
mmetsp:Transcript_1132/g.1665  ORF Transcript_1132/g.1665 Transcript_1132/m.1665 type:complete len:293 (-) Transcript_1132:45-923(-)|eukprot:CAMPEP_0194205336 /NCGR_PEP_ID=MMETSP0156-20130528/4643_1 /TAXON_ID=33649 /ORGANISM="Thalassionema nitzschioides, Strain L26-B" /LENGTH=292 /DNA_ID=CAMNT_0038931587 /DNA_START=98 /DNA_END=976 /DNA_ORIENTATION=+